MLRDFRRTLDETRAGLPLICCAVLSKLANRIGDLTYAAYACHNLNSDLLFAGETLPEVQAEAKHGLAFAEKMRFGLVIDIITAQLALDSDAPRLDAEIRVLRRRAVQ